MRNGTGLRVYMEICTRLEDGLLAGRYEPGYNGSICRDYSLGN